MGNEKKKIIKSSILGGGYVTEEDRRVISLSLCCQSRLSLGVKDNWCSSFTEISVRGGSRHHLCDQIIQQGDSEPEYTAFRYQLYHLYATEPLAS